MIAPKGDGGDKLTTSFDVPRYFKRTTSELTSAELCEYEAIAYEIEMLAEIATWATLPASAVATKLVRNVYAESFAVHFRNVSAFLWPPTGKLRDDDVVASHFLKDSAVSSWPPSEPSNLGDLIKRVGGEVAHLTTRRLPGEHPMKAWRPAECIQALLPALGAFLDGADPAKISPKVEAEVTRLRQLVGNPVRWLEFEQINLTTTTTRSLGVYR